MSGLIVLACTGVGAVIGGCGGIVAAMLWADMEPASLEPLAYMVGGAAAGAAAGAFVGGSVVG